MSKKLLIGLSIVSIMLFSGCASILGGGTKQTVSISRDSNKRMKAVVTYSDGSKPQYLTIPGTITMVRANKDLKIESKEQEFQPVIIEKELNPFFWGNILFGYTFPVFSTTDAVSGAMWKYDEAVILHVDD